MLQYLNQKRGQSTLEYAVLIVVIIGALLTIQVYIKRSIQGRLKQAGDDIGDQYSDGNTNEIKTTIRDSNTLETFNAGNASSSIQGPEGEITNTIENSIIDNTQSEYWGSTTPATPAT
jgi:Flp pilus assembly pilin Flp